MVVYIVIARVHKLATLLVVVVVVVGLPHKAVFSFTIYTIIIASFPDLLCVLHIYTEETKLLAVYLQYTASIPPVYCQYTRHSGDNATSSIPGPLLISVYDNIAFQNSNPSHTGWKGDG